MFNCELNMSFLEYMQTFSRAEIYEQSEKIKADDVVKVLGKNQLTLNDYLTLLSPASLNHLESIAERAQNETLKYFGKAINLFTPLYLSDHCINQCRYCGFNAKNELARNILSVDEAEQEAKVIAKTGLGHILLLTGDAVHISSPEYIAEVATRIKPYFASIGVEVYVMDVMAYAILIASGVDSMTMFQETYNLELYEWLHPKGPKHNYVYRLDAPARAARQGIRSLGMGALLGLDDFIQDAFFTGLHAQWLQNKFPGIELSVSVPRIRPHEGSFEVKNDVSDAQLVQYIIAIRCFLPRVGITLSTRESSTMRNNLLPLGITRISAGVSTAVGGRKSKQLNEGQFEISDQRSVQTVINDLAKMGFQALCKDWERPRTLES